MNKMNIRLANKQDLPALEKMFKQVVLKMNENGINIWNDYYPFEAFKGDIENNRLYLLVNETDICATFGLFDSVEGKDLFKWETNQEKALYIGRLGVNVNYLRKGIGTKAIDEARKLVKQKKGKYLRLTVGEENIPAINLYLKNGFNKVDGMFSEYSETLDKTIHEIGFELKI